VKTKEFYKIKRCMAGINFMTILSNWDVVKCLHAENPENREVYGNILKDDLENIWDKKILKSIKDKKNFCIKSYYLSKMQEKFW
jgi:radical SAM protein with 4Fe4S-binding SPASM domain